MTDSIVFRNGTVLTMDDSHTVHQTGDVLVVGDRIEAVGAHLEAPEVTRDFFDRRRTGAGDLLGFQLAFDVTGDPGFPEKAAFEVARELGLPVTTHAGVWGATNDDGIRLIHEHGFASPDHIYVHAATLST